MNVIEKTKELLESFPKISEVSGVVHVDHSDGNIGSYSLSPTGDVLISEDILGNQRRRHTFLLSAYYSAFNDYERISSSGVLLELAVWLSAQQDIPIETLYEDKLCPGMITRISTANGMLYAVPNENNIDAYVYQLTISADYTIELN